MTSEIVERVARAMTTCEAGEREMLQGCKELAPIAIRAFLEAAEREGWVMVPKEPTPRMLGYGRLARGRRSQDYTAMLAAASRFTLGTAEDDG